MRSRVVPVAVARSFDDTADVSSPPPIDPAALRGVLGHFLTGVTVITAVDPESGAPTGLAASSFTSVSMAPQLVSFCAAKTSSTWPRLRAAGHYCVNILGEDHGELSRRFASKAADKFDGLRWRREASGAPVLEDALAWIDCALHDAVDAGDHVIALGRVLWVGARDGGRPLAYYRGGYGKFTP